MPTLSRPLLAAAAALCVAGRAVPAAAQEAPRTLDADPAVDGAIAGGALAGAVLMMLTPVDTSSSWDTELYGSLDLRVRDNYSSSAAKLADGLVAVAIVTPLALNLGGELDEALGDRLLVYGESLSLNLFVNHVTKYLVQRPRPYTYNPHPEIERIEREQGKDSRLSFYSAHASISFGAAVTGSYLYALSAPDQGARALVWGFTLDTATATSNLRVRAGKHYYSDVVVGAIVGAGIGYLVPALHTDGGVYTPSGVELAGMAGGVAVGALASQLIPFENDALVRLDRQTVLRVRFAPLALSGGGGLSAIGTF